MVSTSFDLIQRNEKEADSCKSFYYKNSCAVNPIIEKYLTWRPKADFMDVYCSLKLNPKSNKTILITGNSFVYFQIYGILEAIKKSKTQFLEVFVVEHPQCNILVGYLNDLYRECSGIEKSHDRLFEQLKPDVIIHSARMDLYVTSAVSPKISFKDDEYYYEIKRQILHIASFTRRLIIIEPHPPFTSSTQHYGIPAKEFHRKHNPSWNRVKEAVKHCKNCVIVQTQNIMCPNGICPMVDPITRLSLFCDKSHVTPRQSLKFVLGIIKALNGIT
uniref:SGNH domain-containing protein n=1 Tax=Panagrolaimus sp. PS1159 TaxID=55785 RepID=A0AC35GS02_9BILA